MQEHVIAGRTELRRYTEVEVAGFMEGLSGWRVAQWLPAVPFPYMEDAACAFIASTAWTVPPDALAVAPRHDGQFWEWSGYRDLAT